MKGLNGDHERLTQEAAVRLAELERPDRPPTADGLAEPNLEQADPRLWRQLFLSARTPRVQLTLLQQFGFNDRELLWALPGLSGRTLRRWRSSGDSTEPPAARREQIDDVRAIVGLLLSDGSFDNQVIVAWLTARQEDLELMRPLEAIGEGRFREVLRAAERFISPARPIDAKG